MSSLWREKYYHGIRKLLKIRSKKSEIKTSITQQNNLKTIWHPLQDVRCVTMRNTDQGLREDHFGMPAATQTTLSVFTSNCYIFRLFMLLNSFQFYPFLTLYSPLHSSTVHLILITLLSCFLIEFHILFQLMYFFS